MPKDGDSPPDLLNLVSEHLASATSSWSIGVPGAIAEFHRTARDAARFESDRCIVTALGALRIDMLAGTRAYAYEILSAKPDRWHHGIVLGARADDCIMKRCRTITEIGPDHGAIRPEDRAGVLFDLALGSAYCDFYVRVFDPAHVMRLRLAVGTSLLDACCDLYDDLVHMSPHRVFVSRLARMEIYQRIGEPGTATPEGPHTHVLPRLFRRERSHWSTLGLPADFAPCLTLYPPNPVFDREGRAKDFDAEEHAAFQGLLAQHGDPAHVALKHLVWRMARSGAVPHEVTIPPQRGARIACRVALRQLVHSDSSLPLLPQWRTAFEPRALAS